MSYEEVLENIKKRDKNDMEKEMGALKVAEDAVVIDGSEMTIKEVEKAISNVIDKKLKAKKEQEKISNILTSLDKKVYQEEKRYTKLDEVKKGLLQKMFV